MRRILISLLLAGAAATPALAGPHNGSDRQQASESRQQARDDRQAARDDRQQARQERVQVREQSRADRGGNVNGGQVNVRQDRVNIPQQAFAGGGGAERFAARPNRGSYAGRLSGNQGNYVAPGPRVVTPDSRFGGRDQRTYDRNLRQPDRRDPNVVRSRGGLAVSTVPRPGTQPPLRADNHRRGGDIHWNRNWQHDGHHDWRNYRNHHRSLFHLGLYYDPFGWGYQPFDIGYRMWPAYYGNQYWIDAGMYGLPYPPPGAVWVRYFNDAMLVDTYNGTVLDVIPGFFW